ncbi:c-type cytochrome [Aestuariicoccus sp. MJ-SS9]|uniref:c-type cytochrome n=1 Tax=Aestuariicoccus sp. MJ-SS9 TaxID=3079855 RepID=UPI00290CF855|nr:c-type cytochrome [Aestuariicoccus sp. MJ-SS9]MDU8911783.1 c-type cytochrome [Aestuariicoccus sp. MJ-SS9]
MRFTISAGVAGAVALTFFGFAAQAQSMPQDLGKFEYDNSCATCHGAGGKGDGPMLEHLMQRPSDLTMLSKNNGGVFPVSTVYETISGDNEIGAHGSRDMPAWGRTFRMRAEGDPDFFPGAADRAAYANIRILALIEFLASIQEE